MFLFKLLFLVRTNLIFYGKKLFNLVIGTKKNSLNSNINARINFAINSLNSLFKLTTSYKCLFSTLTVSLTSSKFATIATVFGHFFEN